MLALGVSSTARKKTVVVERGMVVRSGIEGIYRSVRRMTNSVARGVSEGYEAINGKTTAMYAIIKKNAEVLAWVVRGVSEGYEPMNGKVLLQ